MTHNHPHETWQQRTFGVYHTSNGRRLPRHLAVATPEEQEENLRRFEAKEPGRRVEHAPFRPVEDIVAGARSYAHNVGLGDPHERGYGRIRTDTGRVKQIGRAYDALPEFDPAAVPHFQAMGHEVANQYHHLTRRMGVRVEPVDHDPYRTVHEMTADLRDNRRLKVLSTEATGGHSFFSNQDNDRFRAVHDAFGHAATGRGFDAHGEEAAYLAHSRMFSPLARPAMISETRAQNASLHLNGNFPSQKTAILPEHIMNVPILGHEPVDLSNYRSAQRYAVRTGFSGHATHRLARQLAEDMPSIVKMAHDSGDSETVFHCFGGETRYITRDGVKTLAETVGTMQWVLTGAVDDPHGGFWLQAPVVELGEQELWEVTLKRNRRTKVIRATAGHRWLVRRPDRMVTTEHLRKGHRLAHLRARQFDLAADHDGIRKGFVFGDGSIQYRKSQTYGCVTLWGAKRQLGKYFDEVATRAYEATRENGLEGLRYSSGMIGYTKNLPDLNEDPEFLLGWLMGYFAADGSVSTIGQASLSSASLENLERVRDIATVLGIGTYEPSTRMRTGFGSEPTAIHEMDFMAEDLRPEFFLRDEQRARVKLDGNPARIGWTVESVQPTGKVEPVYCVRAHGTDSFALEDNVHTANCAFCGSGQVIARSDGTIECEFCKACFTVQIQPQYPAFPQTINGVPVQVPGMGPQWPGQPGAEPGQSADQLPPGAEEPEDGEQPTDDAQPGEPTDEDSGEDENPFAKKSAMLYRTAQGTWLAYDQYVRHVALATSRDKIGLAARMRTASGR